MKQKKLFISRKNGGYLGKLPFSLASGAINFITKKKNVTRNEWLQTFSNDDFNAQFFPSLARYSNTFSTKSIELIRRSSSEIDVHESAVVPPATS